MKWLSGIGRFFKGLRAGRKATTVVKLPKVGEAAGVVINTGRAAGATVLSWGNAAKIAITGAAAWLFLQGGLSNVISTSLGIPEEYAQLMIWVVVIILIIWLLNWFFNWFRSKALPRKGSGRRRAG